MKHRYSSPRKARFVREYARDFNGTQAAIRAGYHPHSAGRTAYKLLQDPVILAAVHKGIARLHAKTDVTAERVLTELARIAYGDITAMVRIRNGRVCVADSDALTQDQRSAIAEISETADGIRVKLADKTKALEMLGKRLALWTDRTELTGAGGEPLVINVNHADTQPDAEAKPGVG